MKFIFLYDGKQIRSVHSAVMTFTDQLPINKRFFGRVGALHQWRVKTNYPPLQHILLPRDGVIPVE